MRIYFLTILFTWLCVDASMGAVRWPKYTTSSDGLVRVYGYDDPADEVPFRGPILAFATRVTRTLDQAYALATRFKDPAIVIYAGEDRTNDVRVIVKPQKDRSLTKIFLPSPGFSDLETLRFSIARAYFRARTFPMVFPDWVVQGALRAADTDERQSDVRAVLSIWSTGRLPFFPALCTDLRVAKGPAAALSGYVVGWMKERKLFSTLIKDLASGKPWDGVRLACQLTGESLPMAQDRANDERLVRLAHSVLSPGRASVWDLTRFSSRLDLYPDQFDALNGYPAISFRDLLGPCRTNAAIRSAVSVKARQMPFYAIGRGDALAEAANAYGRFLLDVARADDVDDEHENRRLFDLLVDAERKLSEAYEKENGKNSNGNR